MTERLTLPTLGLLAISDGRLIGDIGDVYQVISFFIRRVAFKHELPKYGSLAAPIIKERFVGLRGDKAQGWEQVRDRALAEYGTTVEVPAEWQGMLADGKDCFENLAEAMAFGGRAVH